jgi:hypothetical protein
MELNEVPAGPVTLPGQWESDAEQVAADAAEAEADVIETRPLANPRRLRLGVPAAV